MTKVTGLPRLGEEQSRLAGRVAAADDHDRRAGAEPGLHLGGRVVHAVALELLEPVDVEPPVARAAGDDHGAAGDIGAVGEADDEMPGLLTQTASRRTGWSGARRTSPPGPAARCVRSPPEIPVGKPR